MDEKKVPDGASCGLSDANGSNSAKFTGRRAKRVTTRLCELYVSLTQTMDSSLVKYYLQRGELKKLLQLRRRGSG